MVSLTTAFVAAVLALIGNIVFRFSERHRERCSIAAALASEISAYIRNLDPPTAAANYRQIAASDRATRRGRLKSMPTKLPTTHPVFDKVADKIGLLPAAEARDVSAIYNVVTGMRLMISTLSSDGLTDAEDEVQIARLDRIVEAIEENHRPALDLVERLEGIANQSLWTRLSMSVACL